MESSEIQTAVASAVEEVLETMCFTAVLASAEGAVAPQQDREAPMLAVEVNFQGSPSGSFRVAVPMRLARVVGAAFLGKEEGEASDSQAQEVVCELANMICGSALSRLESTATFRITHPELTPFDPGAGFDGSGICRWFDLGDGFLVTCLQLRQPI